MTTYARTTNNAYAGLHRCPRNPAHSFDVYYKHRGAKRITERAGWYWRPAPFDELTDEDHGPFTSSRAAYRDALNVEN